MTGTRTGGDPDRDVSSRSGEDRQARPQLARELSLLHQETVPGLAVRTSSTATPGDGTGGTAAVVSLEGELDRTTSSLFEDALHRVLDGGPERLVVDASALTFCDAGGLGVLMRTTVAAHRQGVEVAVVALSPRLVRLCALLWPGPQPRVRPDVAAALEAALTPSSLSA